MFLHYLQVGGRMFEEGCPDHGPVAARNQLRTPVLPLETALSKLEPWAKSAISKSNTLHCRFPVLDAIFGRLIIYDMGT